MERITITVDSPEVADKVRQLLADLKGVSLEADAFEEGVVPGDPNADFFSLSGIWENTDITLESIRRKAWARSIPTSKDEA